MSQPTMARIERGDPAVAMASYVICMWLVNQAAGLAGLIAPQNDHAALEREVTKVRSRGLAVAAVASAKPGGSLAATRHENTVAGLAALLSKTELKSK